MPGRGRWAPRAARRPRLADAVGPLAVVASRGALPTARELAEQLVRGAARTGDPTHRVLQAHDALGATLFQLGAYAAAWRQFAQALALCDPTTQRDQALHNVAAPSVRCLVVGAHALWCLGFPTQAAQRCQEALALAQELAHPYSLVVAQHLRPFCIATGGRCRRCGRRPRRSWRWPRPRGFRSTPGMGTAGGAGRGPCRGGGGGPGRDAPGPDAGRGRGAGARAALWLVRLGEAAGHVGQVAEGGACWPRPWRRSRPVGGATCWPEAHRLQGRVVVASRSAGCGPGRHLFPAGAGDRPAAAGPVLGAARRAEPEPPVAAAGQGRRARTSWRRSMAGSPRALRRWTSRRRRCCWNNWRDNGATSPG